MKRCSRCGWEIPESAATCDQCNAQATVPAASIKEESAAPIDLSAAQPAIPTMAPAVPRATPVVAPAAPVVPPAVPLATAATPIATPPPPVPLAKPVAATAAARAARVSIPASWKAAGGSNRRMLLAAFLVVGGGTLTFAMLRSSAPAVPVSTSAAAARGAAAKPAGPNSAPAAAPVAAAPVVPSKWKAANSEWLLNAKRGVAFELPSQNRVGIWQGIARPSLVVRCDAGHIQAFVYTASAIQMEAVDENHTVRISFDGQPEVTERWADSSDHDALFAPDGAAFAHRVTTATTLKFTYTPHNAPRAVAEFQTSGLTDLIGPAAKQCGWKN
jgi:hypothetical protein